MFESIEEVIERFAGQKYIASRRIATVVYLAADYSSWITGQLLGVCGGSSLPPPAGDFSHLARLLFADDMARDFDIAEAQ